MAFFITDVLSVQCSISAQEPKARERINHPIWQMTCYDLLFICFKKEKNNSIIQFYIDDIKTVQQQITNTVLKSQH